MSSGTWVVRLIGFSVATGGVSLADPNAAELLGPSSGTCQLAVDASGADFLYLDGSGVPIAIGAVPGGFAPADAFNFHHITFLVTAGDSVEYVVSGLFDQTFTGAFGTSPPFFTDTPLTGMTLVKLTALLGSHATLTMVSGAAPGAEAVAQSTTPFDADFTVRIEGTYTAGGTISDVSPAIGPAAGGTVVTLTGIGFTGTTGVLFGSVAASGVVVVDDTKITCVAPAHAVGDVTVTLVV